MTNQYPLKGRILVLDFDGTCVAHDFPRIGKDIGAAPYLRLWQVLGGEIVLFTMRSGHHLDAALEWFAHNQITLMGINENPRQASWTSSPKPYGTEYLDDAAIGAPLIHEEGQRPHIDWNKVGKYFEQLVGKS